MDTRIIELTASIEMTKEIVKTEAKRLKDNIIAVLNNTIINPLGGYLIRGDFRDGFREDGSDSEIIFEIGFWNDAEGRVDFGSDVWFTCSKIDGLGINYGTIGTFHKNDIYQLKRIQLLNGIVSKIFTIEEELFKILDDMGTYRIARNEAYTLERELALIERAIEDKKVAVVLQELSVGDTIEYPQETPFHEKLWKEPTYGESAVWTIAKINHKYVVIETGRHQTKVNKDYLARHIVNDKIIHKKEVK